MSLGRQARAALDEVLGRDDPAILGIVLSGSAARGMATEHSDVDVYVVLTALRVPEWSAHPWEVVESWGEELSVLRGNV